MKFSVIFTLLITFNASCDGRLHKLVIKNDDRQYIQLTTFGFLKGGMLDVSLENFIAEGDRESDLFGFSLDRVHNDAMNPYMAANQDHCLLDPNEKKTTSGNVAAVLFTMDRKNQIMKINATNSLNIRIFYNLTQFADIRAKRDSLSNEFLFNRIRRAAISPTNSSTTQDHGTFKLYNLTLPMKKSLKGYSTTFYTYVPTEKEEGLYNLYFHNCANYEENRDVSVSFVIKIGEKNKGNNYLSAGEMPLPALYFMMSILFFLSGCFWVFILVKSNHTVFKIHYLMTILVYLKSLSLFFHAVNFHFIETEGEHEAAWAILYYIAHLLKGSVLFITIVLIGTGWTFIKHLLSERDKKIFMIVIPLQVLANVVKIIIEESEEGDVEHKTWLYVFMLVDLLCCGAILFPVVWSIRYLQEAANIDGKAAINLRKLKLFRHFYIMIVCYIYFTRIIVYLLRMTVPFQYEWLDEMFREMGTYVFFVLTGYKFRPASANPYFQVNSDEDDDSEDIVLSQCGVTEGLSKLSRISNDQNEEEIDSLLISKRESSHEYD